MFGYWKSRAAANIVRPQNEDIYGIREAQHRIRSYLQLLGCAGNASELSSNAEGSAVSRHQTSKEDFDENAEGSSATTPKEAPEDGLVFFAFVNGYGKCSSETKDRVIQVRQSAGQKNELEAPGMKHDPIQTKKTPPRKK